MRHHRDGSALPWRAIAMWTAFGLTAVVMAALSVSNVAYEATLPPHFALDVALRKIYALAAFTILGFVAARALGRPSWIWQSGAIVAAFSVAIEIAQRYHGAHESMKSHAFDVLSGFVGGALGALCARWFTDRQKRS